MADSPDVLPLQLLQPLDANQQGSAPTPLGGVHRLLVSPDPGVTKAAAGGGDERGWRSSRLRIHRNGQIRSIWAVHLPGWQQLGWQLLPPAPLADAPELPAGDPRALAADAAADAPADAAEQPEPIATAAPTGLPTFQAMTKAQIISHCLSRYGVSLDADRTKADLVAAATALAAGDGETEAEDEAAADVDAVADPDTSPAADPIDLQLPDDLL